jgi:hypothetical protein
MVMKLDVLGLTEITALLGSNGDTVKSWYRRGKLPTPDAVLSCGPIWRRSTIERWLAAKAA